MGDDDSQGESGCRNPIRWGFGLDVPWSYLLCVHGQRELFPVGAFSIGEHGAMGKGTNTK